MNKYAKCEDQKTEIILETWFLFMVAVFHFTNEAIALVPDC